MNPTRFAADVRETDGGVVIALTGDINALAEDDLERAVTQALATDTRDCRPRLRGHRLHQQHRHRPRREPAPPGPRRPRAGRRLRTQRPLPGDLRDHPSRSITCRSPTTRRAPCDHRLRSSRGGPAMPEASISMDVRQPADGAAVIDIDGQITGFAENVLMDAYTQATKQGAKSVLLNFANLDYMNSSGIGLLVTLLVRTQAQRAAAGRVRPQRPLPRDLPAHPARRGDHDPRRRGRAHSRERIMSTHGLERRPLGEGRRPPPRRKACPLRRSTSTSRVGACRAPSRASAHSGRRPTGRG